jgi:hypothetical protein
VAAQLQLLPCFALRSCGTSSPVAVDMHRRCFGTFALGALLVMLLVRGQQSTSRLPGLDGCR